jgi:HSP20 family protein
MLNMQQFMDRTFGEFGDGWTRAFSSPAALPVDAYQTEKHLVVMATLPGFEPSEVEIYIQNGVLTISAQRQEQSTDDGRQYLRRERHNVSMRRELSLPYDVKADKAQAEFHNGVLTLTLPKDPNSQAVRISAGNGAKPVKAKKA